MLEAPQVEPFIEVRVVDPDQTGEFHEQIRRTDRSEGQCPEFNQFLEFEIHSKNKGTFTKAELEQSKIMINISLFDQKKKVEKITANHELTYYENIYLGSC